MIAKVKFHVTRCHAVTLYKSVTHCFIIFFCISTAFGHWTRIEYSIELRFRAAMTLNIHYLCHALLFQCIFTGEYIHLLAPYHSQANCILTYVNKIVEFKYESCLRIYCVVQSSFHDRQ